MPVLRATRARRSPTFPITMSWAPARPAPHLLLRRLAYAQRHGRAAAGAGSSACAAAHAPRARARAADAQRHARQGAQGIGKAHSPGHG